MHKYVQNKVEISSNVGRLLVKRERLLAAERIGECLEEIAYIFQICQCEQGWGKHTQ